MKKRLALVTTVYWVLLMYIVAALVWWFVSLNRQNQAMAELRIAEVDPAAYDRPQRLAAINDERQRKTTQYIGEGATFLLLIMVGALFVYRSTRRQLKLGQQQQNFMMAITHELKTPIAVASLNLETLQKRRLDETQQQRIITNTLQETKRLNDLCNNILLTSQIESGSKQFAKEELDLSALVQDVVQQFRQRFPSTIFNEQLVPDAPIMAEPLMLQLLVSNLLENAIKYSPKQSTITIKVDVANEMVRLQVMDEGQGIPDEEKEKVFSKFYRIGNENTRRSKGTGLGLYLCRKIMDSHRGHLEVTDNTPAGSVFTATFHKTS